MRSSPITSSGTPPIARTRPSTSRRRNGRGRVVVTSVVAAIGETRAARTAGHSDAAIVTSTPSPNAATMVRVSTTSAWVGTANPS